MQAAGQGESGMVGPPQSGFPGILVSGSRRPDEIWGGLLRRSQKGDRALNDSFQWVADRFIFRIPLAKNPIDRRVWKSLLNVNPVIKCHFGAGSCVSINPAQRFEKP
jgi:hypothetical protein